MTGPDVERPSGREVARFRLPLAVRGMDKMVAFLAPSYGEGLLLHQDGDWLVITQPVGV